MLRINRNQKIFISAEYLYDINPLEKYQILFAHLSTSALSIDSYLAVTNVKENNLKTTVKDRFYKHYIPKADPDCRLGVTVQFLHSGKKVSFF